MIAPTPPRRMPALVVRPLRPADEAHVRRIFCETIALGSPVHLPSRELDRYADLCLEWYLEHFEGSLVVVEDGIVRGYLLVCLDTHSQTSWSTRRAVRWGSSALLRVLTGRARGDARRFITSRIRDGLALWRAGSTPPFPAHAHVNLDPQLRGVNVGHQLLARMDQLVAAADLPGWFGEMNWPSGTSYAAVEEAGAIVIERHHNHTLSWLAGIPIERATVVRPLAAATDSAVRRIA